MRRYLVFRALFAAILAALMLLASGDAPRVAASGIPGTIHTVAGGGVGDGGPATDAAVYYPTGVALDTAGRLYIADTLNCRVRRVSGGVITAVAGSGFCGYSGDFGAATAAMVSNPAGVAIDADGALYIADLGNCRVRRVFAGVITTVAGTGICGYSGDGAAATSAALNNPQSVAVDAAGDLYIGDTGNCRVRQVSGGVITTVAGTGVCGYSGDGGAATAAALNGPEGVALEAGVLYIADAGNCRVRRVSGGVITTVAGTGVCGYSGDGGPATAATLNPASHLAADAAGDLYIGDANNCRVRRVSGGVITTVAGTGVCAYSGDGGPATAAALSFPRGVARDAAGDLYIADTINCRVRRVSGGVITTVAGTGACVFGGDGGAATAATLQAPRGVALDGAGALYIADALNCRVRRVSGGVITTVAGTGVCEYSGDGGAATAAAINQPLGVVLGAGAVLYFADWGNCRVRRVSGGMITTVAGTGVCFISGDGSGDGGAATSATLNPVGVALDAAGDLYIADQVNHRVRRVSGGVITTVAGGVLGNSGDGGPATAAGLNHPGGVALDAAGGLYIADSGNCRVRKVSGGIITTVAGSGFCGYSGDGGAATAAALSGPVGVGLDAAGGIYIADGCRVRRVSGGIITTVAGTGVCGYSGDSGPAIAARIDNPLGVALDAVGDLYVADTLNNRVRVVHTSPCPFDLSSNGTVDFSDLLLFAKAYNSMPPDPNWNPAADFNQDGQVGFPDLLLFADKYNDPAPNCPP